MIFGACLNDTRPKSRAKAASACLSGTLMVNFFNQERPSLPNCSGLSIDKKTVCSYLDCRAENQSNRCKATDALTQDIKGRRWKQNSGMTILTPRPLGDQQQ